MKPYKRRVVEEVSERVVLEFVGRKLHALSVYLSPIGRWGSFPSVPEK